MANVPGFTEEQYIALKNAYAEGVTEVKYGDKKVVYRDAAEMENILNRMEAELYPDTKRTQRRTAVYNSTK